MRFFILMVVGLLSVAMAAEYPSGAEILQKIDDNMASDTRIVIANMLIHSRRDTRSVASKSWSQGTHNAYTEYLAPPREQGTKMLKLEDRLWIYTPSTDRIIQISGHLLRQSVMGSDLSYEDLMENPHLSETYTAQVSATEVLDGRSCWVLQLLAKQADVAYHTRTLWVDRERYVPLKQALYAKSGKLLKNTDLKDFKQIGQRWFPLRMIYKDVLKTGEGTEFVIESIQFDVLIPAQLFSKAALRR